MNDHIIPEDLDAIVIGTGIGGATIGFALAKNGKKVLFCESGYSHLNSDGQYKGQFAEQHIKQLPRNSSAQQETWGKSGRWLDEIVDKSFSKSRRFIPLLGVGTGGSSSLYGMAMERFLPYDFEPRKNFSNCLNANLPSKWPVSYEELEPYYVEAEKLYRIRGTKNPLVDNQTFDLPSPPALTDASNELFEFFVKKNLHPYRLPLACEFIDGCQGCQGFLCAKQCKNDSQKICLEPAINQYGAILLDKCEVIRLESKDRKVTGVHCISNNNKPILLKAKVIILAAGALRTPQILLNSSSVDWPLGLANDSGLVGRNLMRHFVDLYAISTKSKYITGHMKEIALNDFYYNDDLKLGTVQSFGHLPPSEILVDAIALELKEKSVLLALFFKAMKPFTRIVLSWLLSKKVILVSILEDLPYLDNRVSIDRENNQLIINYHINQQSSRRIEIFRDKMKKMLKPYRFMQIKQAESNDRIAHACGTCRFGDDPKESVLDRYNRAHGVTNLYVVDSSFFPSSGGTNPSLTIAANALRVADHIINSDLLLADEKGGK